MIEKGPEETVKRHSGEQRNKSEPEKIGTIRSYKEVKQRRIMG